MSQQTEKLVMDASGFIPPIDAIIAKLKALSGSNAQVKVSFNEINEVTGKTTIGLTQLASSNQKLTATLKEGANGLELVKAKLAEVASQADKTEKQIKVFGLTWGSVAKLLAVTVIRHAFLNIASGIRDATKAAAEFQAKLGQLQAFNPRVGNTQQLSQQFGAAANQFNQSIEQVATSATQGVQAGVIRTANDLNVLTEAMRLAQLSGGGADEAMRTLSGTMQAFHLPATEAANTVNQLFRAAQHGLSPELGNSLANVSVIASRLGISLPELLRSFELLRARGSSGSDALAQLNATFTGLERRTPALDAELRRLGYTSIQAAIADRGWAGALNILKDRMDDTGESARRLLSSRRSTGGLTLGQELAGPNAFNDRTGNAEEAARAGRVIRENTTYQAEFNKIATAFATEIGPKILEAFSKFGSFSAPIIKIANELAKWAPAIAESLNGLIIWASWLGKIAELIGIINPGLQESAAATRRLADARANDNAIFDNEQSRQREIFEQNAQAQERAVINAFKPQVTEAERAIETTREATRTMQEQAESAAKVVMHALGNILSSFEGIVKKSEAQIKESLKQIGQFSDKIAQDAFKHRVATAGNVSQVNPFTSGSEAVNAVSLNRLQTAGTENQLTLYRDRIARVTREVAELYKKGDDISVASARKKTEELISLSDQYRDIQSTQSHRDAVLRGQLTGRAQQFNPFNNEREEDQRAIAERQRVQEEALRTQIAAREAAARAGADQQRVLNNNAQRATQDVFRNNSLVNSRSEINPDFAGSNGRETLRRRIQHDIDASMAAINQAHDVGLDRVNQMQSSGQITTQQADQMRRQLPSQQSRNEQQRTLENFRDARLNQLDAANRHVDIKTRLDKIIEEIKNGTRVFAEIQQRERTANAAENQGIDNAQTIINNMRGHGLGNAVQSNLEIQRAMNVGVDLEAPNNAYTTALQQAQDATLTAQQRKTPENTNALMAALQRAGEAFVTLSQARSLAANRQNRPRGEGEVSTDQAIINQVRDTIGNLREANVNRMQVSQLLVQEMNRQREQTNERTANQFVGPPAPTAEQQQSSLGGGSGLSGIASILTNAAAAAATGAVPAANAQTQQAIIRQVAGNYGAGITPGSGTSGGSSPFGLSSSAQTNRFSGGVLGSGSGAFGAGGNENSVRDNGLFGTPVNINNIRQTNAATLQDLIQRGQMTDPDQIARLAQRYGVNPDDLTPAIPYTELRPGPNGVITLPSPRNDEEGFAGGGLIGDAFSAMGPDNVRINARVGEFVMNPDSTARFYTQLVSMNRGDSPKGNGYASGGTVSNSIGNLAIHVNGSESPEKTARAVYNHIRREQRRGNI